LNNPQAPTELRPILQEILAGKAPTASRETVLAKVLERLDQTKTASLDGINRLEQASKQAFTQAISGMCRISSLIILLGFLITLFMPEIPLRKTNQNEQAPI
jgi:hypothetical protein